MRVRQIFILSVTAILTLAAGVACGSYSGGTGDPNNPYQIADANDLLTLAADTNDYGKCFIMTADVNMAGQAFTTAIIASNDETAFTGTFDGNGYKVTDFTINGDSYVGLFGQINSGGSVKNLGLANFVISSSSDSAGGLAAYNYGSIYNCYSSGRVIGDSNSSSVGGLTGENDGNISNCYSSGTVSGGANEVGGLVGENDANISNCYSTGQAGGDSNSYSVGGLAAWNYGSINNSYSTVTVSGSQYMGGLVGKNFSLGSINGCYSAGQVSGSYSVGGLVGWNDGSVSNCYSMDSVNGSSGSYFVGGLAGKNDANVSNCYSTGQVSGDSNSYSVGGLVGDNDSNSGSVLGSFWDANTSGQTASSGGTGETTAQMQTLSTFTSAGWNFDGNPVVWFMPIGEYPILLWQPGASTSTVTVPNFVGMAAADANTAIIDANLVVGAITTAYSNSVAAGKIISQSPTAGTTSATGSAVNYVESLGEPTVPNVVGMSAADANTAIIDANFVVGAITTAYSNTVAAGKVISQSPTAGTTALLNTDVDIVVSLGASTSIVNVPNVLGMTSGAANTAISKAHLKVGTVTKAYSNTVPAGDVISTNPVAGTEVLIGSKVNYVKSLGEPAVPKIVGKKVADANTAISNATLVVGTVTTAYSNNIAVGKVISLSPVAGTRVAIGSDVNYVESLGKPTEPNIVGMAAADANAAIATAGGNLKVGKVTAAYSNTVAAGNVISQSPAAGKKVTIGSAVNYVESLGKPIVPDVLNMTSSIANTAISKAHLKVGTVTTAYSDTVVAGEVISTNPIAGTAVLIGSKVNYVKSRGKPIVPNVVGKTVIDANTAIVSANLVVGTVTTAYSNTVAVGKVISQTPAVGAVVTVGSAVNYVESLGKNP